MYAIIYDHQVIDFSILCVTGSER